MRKMEKSLKSVGLWYKIVYVEKLEMALIARKKEIAIAESSKHGSLKL
jgi:hypothetical protein